MDFEDILALIGSIIGMLYFIRYFILYLNRISTVEQKLHYMNKMLERVEDPSNYWISFHNYEPVNKRIDIKTLINHKYLTNKLYNKYYEKYLELENYKKKFIRIELKIYIIIILVLTILSIIYDV